MRRPTPRVVKYRGSETSNTLWRVSVLLASGRASFSQHGRKSRSRILDRDAFLAFACDTVFELLHDDDDAECQPTWWLRFSQAIGEEAANCGAGVRRNDGTDSLPIDQPPNLFPDEVPRELLGQHIKESSLSA